MKDFQAYPLLRSELRAKAVASTAEPGIPTFYVHDLNSHKVVHSSFLVLQFIGIKMDRLIVDEPLISQSEG